MRAGYLDTYSKHGIGPLHELEGYGARVDSSRRRGHVDVELRYRFDWWCAAHARASIAARRSASPESRNPMELLPAPYPTPPTITRRASDKMKESHDLS